MVYYPPDNSLMGDAMSRTAEEQAFMVRLGAEIRAARESLEMSGEDLAEWLDWGRDAVSKIETAKNRTSVYDYVRLITALRDALPDHPAIAIGRRLQIGRR